MGSSKKSVAVLAAERQRLYDEFNGTIVDDEAVDVPLLKKAEAVEARILKATFKTSADKRSGIRMLAGGDNLEPHEWCVFKINLFKRMMKFA